MMRVTMKLMMKILMNLKPYLQGVFLEAKESTKVSFLSFVLTTMRLVILLLGALVRGTKMRSMETSKREEEMNTRDTKTKVRNPIILLKRIVMKNLVDLKK